MLIVPNIIEETSKGIQSFTIQDSMLRNREIFLTGEINEESATEIIRQLMYLESRSSDPVTPVYQQSGRQRYERHGNLRLYRCDAVEGKYGLYWPGGQYGGNSVPGRC